MNQERKLQHLTSFQSPIAENPADDELEQLESPSNKREEMAASGGQDPLTPEAATKGKS